MWRVRAVEPAQVARLQADLGIGETAARLLWLRGWTSPEAARTFWEGRDEAALLRTPPTSLGLARAVERLKRAFAAHEPIVIYGDYDADGVTATALLYRYLKAGPHANVIAYLPDRFLDGYGITPAAVRRLHAEGHRLIVTVDNGIAAVEAAAVARSLGVDLIVTDHHQVPEVLPEACALVHPQLDFPAWKDLAGVGVAFVLCLALEGRWSERLRSLLDLVALGSVADVVSLAGPNRALVWAGLQHIRTSARLRPGLQALIDVTGHAQAATLTARNIAFSLAPMINAAGRIEQPKLAFDLLVAPEIGEARKLATALADLNAERRELDRTTVEQVLARLEADPALTRDDFLVLADATFHHGITGIVAGRLKERLRKPVLLLSPHEDGLWKGSGRSLEGCHLYEALASCQHLLVGFGGHAQAAGCSVREEAIPALRECLNAYLRAQDWRTPAPVHWLDAAPPLSAYTPELLAELERFEPTGQGNPVPALGLMGAEVLRARTDRSGKHLFVSLSDSEGAVEAVAWGQGERADTIGGRVNVQLKPRLKTYRGETVLELQIERIEPAESDAGAPSSPSDGPGAASQAEGPGAVSPSDAPAAAEPSRGHDRPGAGRKLSEPQGAPPPARPEPRVEPARAVGAGTVPSRAVPPIEAVKRVSAAAPRNAQATPDVGAAAGLRGADGLLYRDARHAPDRHRALRERLAAAKGRVAVYWGASLPGLDAIVGTDDAEVLDWFERSAQRAEVDELILWERPGDAASWRALRADVRQVVTCLWEAPVVDPTLSLAWLEAFHRDLGGLGSLSWSQLLGRAWPVETALVRAALALFEETGLLHVTPPRWERAPWPAEGLAWEETAAARAYEAVLAFRRTLSAGDADAVRDVLGAAT